MKPALFITNYIPPAKRKAFALLAEREQVEFAVFGGKTHHAGVENPTAPQEYRFPVHHLSQKDVLGLASSGKYRAVIAGISGRMALPAAYMGARKAIIPFVLWATMWSHPHTLAHRLSYLPLRHIYRNADAIVTYGPHVSEYVYRQGARDIFVAPQCVDNDFWSTPVKPNHRCSDFFQALYVGRVAAEKGIDTLIAAWKASGLADQNGELILIGGGRGLGSIPGVTQKGSMDREGIRNFYASSDVLVLPSVETRTFREPWGLVINEAMNQALPIIASTAVGAVAGGLAVDERDGLVFQSGDPTALAHALVRLARDPQLRERLGKNGLTDVGAYNESAWTAGFSSALASIGTSRGE